MERKLAAEDIENALDCLDSGSSDSDFDDSEYDSDYNPDGYSSSGNLIYPYMVLLRISVRARYLCNIFDAILLHLFPISHGFYIIYFRI